MSISERLYRLLLKLYPAEHRRRYGELMVTHFRDQLREAQRNGTLFQLWLRTLIDIALTAPQEHAEAARMSNVTPWREVLLAILPAALPFLLPVMPDSVERLVLLGLGATYLGILLVSLRQRRPAIWVLPLLGLAGTYAVAWGVFWLGDLLGTGMYPFLFLLVGATLVLATMRLPGRRLPLLLFGLLLATSIAAFLGLGAGSMVALTESLAGPAWILLAAALGLPFARRYGFLAILFVAASAHWAIEATIDPSLQIRFGSWSHLLSRLSWITALALIPLLALRAKSRWRQTLAIMAPLVGYLLLLILLPPLVYTFSGHPQAVADPATLLAQAIGRTVYAVQIVLAMAFALSVYGARRWRNGAPKSQAVEKA